MSAGRSYADFRGYVAAAAVTRLLLSTATKHPLSSKAPRRELRQNLMLRPFWGPNPGTGKSLRNRPS